MNNRTEFATFAAGCFWGVQEIFSNINGVVDTTVGYVGGIVENPTYEQVKTGKTGHAEAVLVEYEPSVISYKELLNFFWRLHDPTTPDKQGVDVGSQYRSAIFCHNEGQHKQAQISKEEFDQSGAFKEKSATEILPARSFYRAEEYHQNYFKKNGGHVCHILREK